MGTLEEVWNEFNDFKTFKNHINCNDPSIEFVTKVGPWQKKQVGKVFETQTHIHKCERVQRVNPNTRKWISIFK